MDFSKLLWDEYKIKYGPKDSYCKYPRQWKTSGVLNKEKIVPLSLSLKKHNGVYWVYIEEGGITGYESARLDSLWDNQTDWCACAGGMGYSRLDIRRYQLMKVIRDMKEHVEVNCGY